MTLGSSFLAVPRIKVDINKHDDWCTEYTVHFRKLKDRLGISVKRVGADIYISEIDGINALNSMCLAQSAGIRIGDILKSVNSVKLNSITRVKTVVEMLSSAGRYVSLVFERRNLSPPSSLSRWSEEENPMHPFSKVLLDQEIITDEMAKTVSQQIEFLTTRAICWVGKVYIALPSLHDVNTGGYDVNDSKNIMKTNSIDSRLQLSKVFMVGSNLTDESWSTINDTASKTHVPALGKFYCDAMLFSSGNNNSNLNQIIDRGVQKAIAAGMYFGLASLELLSGQQGTEVHRGATTANSKVADISHGKPSTCNIGGKVEDKYDGCANDHKRDRDNIHVDNDLDTPCEGGTGDVLDCRKEENTQQRQQPEQEGQEGLQLYEGLRPGLIVHIEGSKRVNDHIEYIIWICDVQSGIEWRVSRRFREFNEFHSLILSLRPSLARSIEFPRKKLNVAEDQGIYTYA